DHDLLLEARHRRLPREVDLGHAADREPADQRVAPAERHRIDLAGLPPPHAATSASGIVWPASACALRVPSIAARTSVSGRGSATGGIGVAGAGAANARSTAVIPPASPSRS